MAADWEGLHVDFLVSILKKIKVIEDFISFGMVCKSWNEVARENKLCLTPQLPWLMLAEDELTKDGRRHIYSLSNDKISSSALYFPPDKRCIGLNYGWLLTISRLSGDLNLLHPLSGSEIKLPNQTSIENYDPEEMWPSYMYVYKAAISGNPSKSPSDFTLMILHRGGYFLSYWRPGDTCWTSKLDTKCGFYDLIYYKDKFYAISYNGTIWAVSCSTTHPNIVLSKVTVIDRNQIFGPNYIFVYLVESSSPDVLLLVVRIGKLGENDDDDLTYEDLESAGIDEEGQKLYEDCDVMTYGLIDFKVYEVDLIKGCCNSKNVVDLGGRAVFVGHSACMSFDASQFDGITPNHIYFTDNCNEWYPFLVKGGGLDMGCYCLEDDKNTQFNVGESRSRLCPPFWFIPSLY